MHGDSLQWFTSGRLSPRYPSRKMSMKHEVTIYDIATALDISPSTVSRALSGIPRVRKDTWEKILNTARQLGYRQNYFASRLRSQHTKLLGAIVPSLNTAAVSAMIAETEAVARLNQYSPILAQPKNEEDL
jgi:LacI family transcriptional regulator